MRSPGVDFLAAAKPDESQAVWDAVYAHLRARLLSIGHLKLEEVQKVAEDKWRSVMVTDKMSVSALNNSIVDVSKCWQEMTNCDVFDERNAEKQRRLMRDLNNKLPPGSPLKVYFTTKEYAPSNFDS